MALMRGRPLVSPRLLSRMKYLCDLADPCSCVVSIPSRRFARLSCTAGLLDHMDYCWMVTGVH